MKSHPRINNHTQAHIKQLKKIKLTKNRAVTKHKSKRLPNKHITKNKFN